MTRRPVLALLGAALGVGVSILAGPPPAHADTQCPYPGVGILGVNVGGINGGFCDFPTEINGAHWHCQGGGVSLGLGLASGLALGGGGNLGLAQAGQGVGGLSCNWRCPDGVDAPAPNPPGQWREYLAPMNTTNYCKDHMTPNGFWSAPTLPTEGIPPVNEQAPQPGEVLPPQPIPPPMPTPSAQPPITPAPPPPGLVPGEPNALQPVPGEPNP
jgi:hypothetical protein